VLAAGVAAAGWLTATGAVAGAATFAAGLGFFLAALFFATFFLAGFRAAFFFTFNFFATFCLTACRCGAFFFFFFAAFFAFFLVAIVKISFKSQCNNTKPVRTTTDYSFVGSHLDETNSPPSDPEQVLVKFDTAVLRGVPSGLECLSTDHGARLATTTIYGA
jgi:hypothetical protein